MPSLGVTVTTRELPPARGVASATSTWFVAGLAGSGPTDAATRLRSIADFIATYGQRAAANAVLYDALDTFFQEGGSMAYVARIGAAGATPTAGEYDTALGLFVDDYGSGQVSIPGDDSAAAYTALWGHAQAHNRFALADAAVDADVAGLTALPAQVPANIESYGAIFAPWLQVPGITNAAATRDVPASAAIAGLCARVDAGGNPNRAAAGRDYPLQYALGTVFDIGDTDRAALLDVGVNTSKVVYGLLENYGFQTPLDPADDPIYWQANTGRLRMALVAFARPIGEAYMFRPLDGRGLLEAALASDLQAMLLGLYQADALYGDTPADAYQVDVSANVNTPDTIAQGELIAVVTFTPTLHTKSVQLQLVSVPITV